MSEPLVLPEYVRRCGVCRGEGSYLQTYGHGCGGGTYRMTGPCDWCGGAGYVYRATHRPVGASVLAQIETMNARSQETTT